MEQLQLPLEMVVEYDYKSAEKIVEVLRPLIFKNDDIYYCLLGPDPTSGVFGWGDSIEEAVEDWKVSLNRFMKIYDNRTNSVYSTITKLLINYRSSTAGQKECLEQKFSA